MQEAKSVVTPADMSTELVKVVEDDAVLTEQCISLRLAACCIC